MSDYEIHDYSDGSVHVHSQRQAWDVAVIAKEDRPKAALAILGGITDEMVDALSKAAWDFGRYADDESGFVESARESVRSALHAVFGIEQP